MNDTADTDIAKAAEAAKQQMDNQRIQDAERRENEQRVSAIRAQNVADQRRIDEDNKRKRDADKALIAKEKADAAESARKAKAEEKIRSNAEAVRNRQEAQESLAAMKRDAAAKAATEKARSIEEAKLARDAKTTSAQRIAARAKIDEMNRAENKRIEEANERIRPSGKHVRTPGMKQITPDTIKESIRSVVNNVPSKLSSTTTNRFGGVAESMIRQPAEKSLHKYYKEETAQLSKAIKPHAKKPITGGKVTPLLKRTQVTVAPNYIDNLLGRGMGGIMGSISVQSTQQKKRKGGGGMFGGLDDFVRRI